MMSSFLNFPSLEFHLQLFVNDRIALLVHGSDFSGSALCRDQRVLVKGFGRRPSARADRSPRAGIRNPSPLSLVKSIRAKVGCGA